MSVPNTAPRFWWQSPKGSVRKAEPKMWFSRVDSSRQCFSLWQPLFQFRSLDVSATGNILYQFCIDHYCFALSPVHTGNKVEFNTVDFVEPATNQWRIQRGATGQGGHAPPQKPMSQLCCCKSL